MKKSKIRAIGNSLGVVIPKAMLDRLQVREGDAVYLVERTGGIEVRVGDPELRAVSWRKVGAYRNAMTELARYAAARNPLVVRSSPLHEGVALRRGRGCATGLLESALSGGSVHRRRCGHLSLAAAMGYGLAKNHPFVDGNKRTAFRRYVSGDNGLQLAPEMDVVITVALAAGNAERAFADWLRANTAKQRHR